MRNGEPVAQPINLQLVARGFMAPHCVGHMLWPETRPIIRFAVASETHAVRLSLPLAGWLEDLHLQASASRQAHQKNRAPKCPLMQRTPSAQAGRRRRTTVPTAHRPANNSA